MKTQNKIKISFALMFIGWLPFMWVCMFGMFQESYKLRLAIVFLGLAICFYSLILITVALKDNYFFKTIEELETQKQRYAEARRTIERKLKSRKNG